MDLEFDLDAIVEVFGEPLESRSYPDRGDYWFEYRRPDGVAVRLVLGAFDRAVIVGVDYGTAASTSVRLEQCDRVRVLEVEKRTLEVTSAALAVRCFLSLEGRSVLTLEAPPAIN